MLLEFPSVVDAVRCVIEVQTAMAAKVAGVPEDGRMAFRIGVNLGDIIIDGDDIFGDGVNVAARLQEIASVGGVCVSSRVHEDVRDRLDVAFEDGGAQTLKNIARPLQVWRWSPSGSAEAASATGSYADALTLPDRPSIAVLPFRNMSADPEQEYFSDGMVDDIITALSHFKSLFVIARNSSFTYKGRTVDVKQVGRELGVRYVLEGSVRKVGAHVRITGQLIDSETGTHLWADRFDSFLKDLFELQDQMTASIVGAIAPKLDQAEMQRAKRKPVENLDAYDCFLRGITAYEQPRNSRDEALRLFYRAIELDRDFATPYAMAARCYAARRVRGRFANGTWEEAETKRLVSRVSAIGRDDALALCWAGHSLVTVCGDLDTGAALIDEALTINPNLAAGWTNRGFVSVLLGDHEAAIEQLSRALRLNPLHPLQHFSHMVMSCAFIFLKKNEEALKWANKALLHRPNYIAGLMTSAVANALAGNVVEAQRIIARIGQLNPTVRISELNKVAPLRRTQDVKLIIEGMRLAGFPE
jgi:TolB-like protein